MRPSLLSQSVKNRGSFSLFFFFFLPNDVACRTPPPRIEPEPPAMEVQWAIREVLWVSSPQALFFRDNWQGSRWWHLLQPG